MALYSFTSTLFFFMYTVPVVIIMANTSHSTMMCHDNERSALLHFKQGFSVNKSASFDSSAYPKTESWKARGQGSSSDCCSWDGVKCDEYTGYVIDLDLSSSLLFGTLHSNSTLFSLVHLRTLNLADNDFNSSLIPHQISHLSSLSTLNLSLSLFSGQIPFQLSRLSKLTSLDISYNSLHGHFPIGIFHLPHLLVLNASDNQYLTGYLPEFDRRNFIKEMVLSDTTFSGNLPISIGNLQSLTRLRLGYCNFSGTLPQSLGLLTHLTYLSLSGNGFHGEFPSSIFHLPHLLYLHAYDNQNLSGSLPEFNQTSSFRELVLRYTNFSGNLPVSIGNLESLTYLALGDCSFTGSIPVSIGNLTQLTYLSLRYNSFKPGKPTWVVKLTKLTVLALKNTNLYGEIPPSLANLTQLSTLYLGHNQLSGVIPYCITNLTRLINLSLSFNLLKGPILSSFSQLENLEILYLNGNYLSGTVEIDLFLNLKKLVDLNLSDNKIRLLTHNNKNSSYPQFSGLQLNNCNLREIPYFLQFQKKLEILFLERNNIHGKIPHWLWNASDYLQAITLAGNFLTTMELNPSVLPGINLGIINMKNNLLQGNLPVPPPNVIAYKFSNNRLTGDISPLICGIRSLKILELSNNSMSGPIPHCLGSSLTALDLQGNNFSGNIPKEYSEGCNLMVMDLSQNQLEGGLPKSLSNCKMLQILDLADNQIEDTFPLWLGALPQLQVLVLHSNKLHGAITSPESTSAFPMLRIIDLSCNSFTGNLPVKYIQIFNAMKNFRPEIELYIDTEVELRFGNEMWPGYSYASSITITNKGVKTKFVKIQKIFTDIDLSCNKFRGEIPESLGSLEGLQSLNLSNNELTGPIPPSIGNLTQLESLDLSQNMLSGAIPQQLAAKLNFLSFINVSYNLLSGHIPQGGQFVTFENNSYMGNSGLCGLPLSKNCGTVQSPSAVSEDEDDSDNEFPSEYDWVFIFAGAGSGLVVGLVLGNILTNRQPWLIGWFVQSFGGK